MEGLRPLLLKIFELQECEHVSVFQSKYINTTTTTATILTTTPTTPNYNNNSERKHLPLCASHSPLYIFFLTN